MLDNCICRAVQKEAYLHEMEHVEKGDFDEAAVGSIETWEESGCEYGKDMLSSRYSYGQVTFSLNQTNG